MATASVQQREVADFTLDVVAAEAVLGGGLPPKAEQHLNFAGHAYHDDVRAEQHLREAQALAPEHVAVLIGLYRFYFYKGRLAEALQVAEVCLEKAARANDLSLDWREVGPGDAQFSSFDAILPRFYLFTLKGCAYLNMRLGDTDTGRAIVQKLLELDPSDKLGAGVLMGVLERMGRDDDDE